MALPKKKKKPVDLLVWGCSYCVKGRRGFKAELDVEMKVKNATEGGEAATEYLSPPLPSPPKTRLSTLLFLLFSTSLLLLTLLTSTSPATTSSALLNFLPHELVADEGKGYYIEHLCSMVFVDKAEEDIAEGKKNSRKEHGRISLEMLQTDGSTRKEKEWKKTLACKLCEKRKVVEMSRRWICSRRLMRSMLIRLRTEEEEREGERQRGRERDARAALLLAGVEIVGRRRRREVEEEGERARWRGV